MTSVIEKPAAIAAPAKRPGMRSVLQRQRWWLGRVAVLPLHLLVFVLLSFVLIRSVPGDPVAALLGSQAWTQADYDQLEKSLGLDGSLLEQLVRYVGGLFTLDLGRSLVTRQEVWDELAVRLPATVELALMGMIVCIVVSIVASLIVLSRPRGIIAKIIGGYSRAAGAVPDFVLAIAGLLLFYATLRWVPAPLGRLDTTLIAPTRITGLPFTDTILQGYGAATASMAAHLVLPVAVLALSQAPIMINLLIAGLRQSLDAPPTLFRIATGAGRRTVLLSVYRRAIPAVITISGSIFGSLIGGAVIVESLFGFSGLGSYAADAVSGSDYPALQGFLLLVAALVLVVFLLVDVVNMVVDPRRRPGNHQEG